MNVVTKHVMDLTHPDQLPQVFCVQGDEFSRMVELEIIADGKVWLIPDGVSVLITYYMPDGSCGTYTQMPDGTTGWEIDKNIIRINLTPHMLTVSGLVVVQLKLLHQNASISTFAFHVLVKPGLTPGVEPETYNNWLTAYLPQTSGAAQGQYLCVTQVDKEGRVTGLVGTDLSVLDEHEQRMGTLEEKTLEIDVLSGRLDRLEDDAEGLDACLQKTAGDIERLEGRVTALEDGGQDLEVLDKLISTLESQTGKIDGLVIRVTDLEGDMEDISKYDSRITALESEFTDLEDVDNRVTVLESGMDDLVNVGNRVSALEESAEDVLMLERRVTALESGTTSLPAEWEDEIQDCISTIQQYQDECGPRSVSFAYFSDNHNQQSYTGALIGEVMEACGMPYSFFCGDMVREDVTDDPQTVEEQIRQFNTMMSPISREMDCRALGEHDYCRTDSDGKLRMLNEMQIYERFFRKQYRGLQRFTGGNGSYFYVDDRIHRIRFIVLNSVWVDQYLVGEDATELPEGYGFGQEQLDWLVNEALYFEDSDWGVVLFSHIPISINGDTVLRDAHLVKGILAAYMEFGSYQGEYAGETSVYVDVDFHDACIGDIIGWFSGHTHTDSIVTENLATDNNMHTELPLNCVTIADDGNTIDFVTIDKDTRTVYLTRLGQGEDRSFTY